MPIANCIVSPDLEPRAGRLIELIDLWAKESTKSSEHMTINIISAKEQHGKTYSVMANLLLPTIWNNSDLSLLQLGLAKALSIYFNIPFHQVQVITTQVASSMVVENGKEIIW